MKKNVLRKINKKILIILIILLMLFPLLSLNVSARTLKRENIELEITPIFDSKGKRIRNLPVVEYMPTKSRKSINALGQATLDSSYNIRSLITSGNQGLLDICWAFGNKNLLETFLRKQYNIEDIFSVRHMDYVLSNIVSNSLNREVGSGAAPFFTFPYFSTNQGPVKEENFPYNTNIDTYSEEELNQNIENIYLEGFSELPTIEKEIVGENINYTVITNDKKIKNFPESQIKELRDRMKRHIMEYGVITAATASSKNQYVTFPAEEFVYNSTGSFEDIDHNISIIGWDDNFCDNNPDGSTSGVQPINSGAWFVSDSNQPKGNQFYYIAYDDVYIEQILYTFNDVSVGTRFDVYRHDLIGANGNLPLGAINTVGDPIIKIANVFNKLDNNDEYINKVGFYTNGNATIEIYYIPTSAIENLEFEKEGTLLKTINIPKREFQYYTVDIDNKSIKIPKGEFAIELIIKDHTPIEEGSQRYVRIPVEAKPANLGKSDPVLDNITYKSKGYFLTTENALLVDSLNFPIRAYTSNKPFQTDTFLVSYDLQDGIGEFPSINVSSGSIVENPQIPTKEGYRFIGWEPNPATTPITKNTVFVAQWQSIPEEEQTGEQNEQNEQEENTTQKNKVAFVFGDGLVQYIELGEDGYVKNIPEPEPKEGYRFLGWNPNPKIVKPNKGTVFYGLWEKLGLNNSGSTETEYIRGTSNDATQANIRIPNAGKSYTIAIIIILISALGIVFFVKYRKIDK